MRRRRCFLIGTILAIAISVLSAASVFSQAQPVYFLVAAPTLYRLGSGDSYILPLTDPADIAYARSLVASGGFKIVFATITAGSDGINRDMLAPGTPEWSWHVTEFLAFGDIGVEICDGTPTLTEAEVQNWSEGAEVEICYYSFSVVAEVAESAPTHPETWGKIKLLFDE